MRQVDPGARAGRSARGAPHPRARGHAGRASCCAGCCSLRRPATGAAGRGAPDGGRPGGARGRGGGAGTGRREWVVSDRYSGSTIAYQGYGRGLTRRAGGRWWRWPPAGWPPTSRSWSTCRSRWRRPGCPPPASADRLERLGTEFASRVREGFLTQAVADPEHWVVVDGTEDVAALTAHIVAAVHDRLGDPSSRPDERRPSGTVPVLRRGGPGGGGGRAARRRSQPGARLPLRRPFGQWRTGGGVRLRRRAALPRRGLRHAAPPAGRLWPARPPTSTSCAGTARPCPRR